MGRMAATTLLQMIGTEKSAWPKEPIRILPRFVERQSTAMANSQRAAQELVYSAR
jgi:DNA-binding LacI/PurR family transcriptional regulator